MNQPSILNRALPLAAAGTLALVVLEGCDAPPTAQIDAPIYSGEFSYLCSGPGDYLCDDGITELVNPDPFIAVGSEFSVKFTPMFTPRSTTFPHGSEVFKGVAALDPKRLELVSDRAKDPSTFKAHVTGFTSLIARNEYRALDILNVTVGSIDRLEISHDISTVLFGDPGTADFTILGAVVGKFRAIPTAENGSHLVGSLPCEWSTSDMDVVAITSSSNDNLVTIRTKEAGKATITVTMGTFQTHFPVTVTLP
jgi:hypothetical protein